MLMWTFISACASVCGDNTCELEENCLTCPADCDVCPMPTSIKVVIGLPVALFCSGFFFTLVVRMLVQCLTNVCSYANANISQGSTTHIFTEFKGTW